MGIIIRNAEEKDRDILVKLHEKFIGELVLVNPEIYKPRKQKSNFLGNFQKVMKSYDILTAEIGGEVVGYLFGNVKEKAYFFEFENAGYISEVYVTPKHRKKKIASMLIEEIIKRYKERGVNIIELTVSSKNGPAISVWEKYGFSEYLKKMIVKL